MPEESIWPEDDEAFPGLSEEEIQVPGRAEMNDFAREEKENAIAVARRELLPPTSRRSKQGNLQRKNPPLVRQANATAAKNQQRNAPLQGYQQRNVLLQVNQQRKVPSQGNQQRNVPARMNPQRNIPAQINQHRNTPAQINSQRNIPAQINQHRNTPVQINSQRNIPAQRNQQKIVPAQINSQRNIPAQRNQQRNVPSQINFQRNDNIPVLTSLSPTSRNVTSPESNVLFITAVPRCGTVTLGALLRRLSSENKFLLETPHDDVKPWMTNGEKQSLLQHLRDLSKGAPVAYLRHLLFFDAARIGILKPIWMAIVRDPVERLISQFYYLRKVSTDSYVKEVGDRRALQMAKYHAETFYSVVGVLEDMSATYRALRHYLPRFFQRSFRADIVTENQRYNAHETARTPPVLNATKALMKSFLKEDYELYHFLRQRLHLQEKTV
ncbi:uncharacterized protein LOC134778531 isoform X2 [Penaeus indicus]|uniref:uncharacterized protein LOC134778531 isoform X2 n=1 Tax=Penaeus indicus TaxID=29960 RepID=UPI00300CA47A